MRAGSRIASLGALGAVLSSACTLFIAASTARAAQQWNDGVPVMSTQVKCVINLQEIGAIAKAGYLADPSKLPKAGEVFYGRAVFGATTDTACSSGDQLAELNLVLPPGVSLAIDATHPITCLYADGDGPQANYPTCPTRTIAGAYGPAIPSDDAGHAWTMPAGREFDVRFPLTSARKLVGPGGGHCPQSLDEIPTSPQRDCLLIALHVVDGYSDPWLTPNEELFIDPATASPTPTPTPTPDAARARPDDTGRLADRLHPRAPRHRGATKGLPLSMHCAKACHGTVKVTVAAATAKRLHIAKGALTLTSGHFSAAADKTATVQLKLSRRLAGKIRKLKSLAVTVTVTPSGAAKTVTQLTLHH